MPALRRNSLRYLWVALAIILVGVPLPMVIAATSGDGSSQSPVMDETLKIVLQNSSPQDRIPVVVEFVDGMQPYQMVAALESLGLDIEIRHAFEIISMVSLYVPAAAANDLLAARALIGLAYDRPLNLLEEPEPSQIVIAENGDGYVHFTEQVGLESLWGAGYNGTGRSIAILDTGIYGDHPDLQGKLIGFKDFINNLDDMTPGDGVTSYDDNGHGTVCAWNAVGTGEYNGGNFTGVAPGASLLGIKILDGDGAGEDSVIAQGIEFAMNQGVDVISLSLGGLWTDQVGIPEPSVAACKAAVQAGVAVVAASGNSGPAASSVNSPGIVEEVITVGSSAGTNGVVAFSSTGPVYRSVHDPLGYVAKPDIVAPGLNVVSGRGNVVTALEYPVYNQTQFENTYTQWSGTSASTPIIGGLILLLLQKHGTKTPLEIKTAMMKSATDLLLDPMAQGYGLVNVTSASELLTASDDITLMAPMRLPTLPWSSQVLIVGDTRPPQNVTIMSTYSLGTVDIEVNGNVSQFVTVSRSSLSVPVGYSHFGVALETPEDPPLSVVGSYYGSIDLVQGTTTIASIEVEFTVTIFGGRLMTDMEHHSAADRDDPSYYGYFTEYLRERGVVLSEFGGASMSSTVIDSTTISSADVFMIMDTETYYSDSEVQALHTFVENGGTLLVLSEFYDSTTQSASYAIDSYNRILEPFGIQCETRGIGVGLDNYGLVYGEDSPLGGAVEADPLMANVSNLYILQGSTLSVNTSIANATGLFWQDSARTHAIVATAEYGTGNVYVISDGSTLYDDVLYDAIRFGADNLQLIENLAAQIKFNAPRIFDVRLDVNRIGESANATAYVFDDDLSTVSLRVYSPDEVNVAGDVMETYGYKYTTNFTLGSGGFYTIIVIATDLEGNERILAKTVLVAVDAGNDMLLLAITYSLVGIVGISLAYVGYLKYFAGRKRKPRRGPPSQEEEWELPPPAIE